MFIIMFIIVCKIIPDVCYARCIKIRGILYVSALCPSFPYLSVFSMTVRLLHNCPSFPYLSVFSITVRQKCPSKVSVKSVRQKCPSKVSVKSVRQKCPSKVSVKSVRQNCPSKLSVKSVRQNCPSVRVRVSVSACPCPSFPIYRSNVYF